MNVNLYTNHSANNVVSKDITLLTSITTDMPVSLDIVNPSFVVTGKYPECNYVHIPYLNRYYYCKATLLSNNTTKLDCKSDVLMSANTSIYNTNQYIARCETMENTDIVDNTIPLKTDYQVFCTLVSDSIAHSNKQFLIGVI